MVARESSIHKGLARHKATSGKRGFALIWLIPAGEMTYFLMKLILLGQLQATVKQINPGNAFMIVLFVL